MNDHPSTTDSERRLSPEDFAARLAAPRDPRQTEATLDLVRWFTTTYPTAKERLAYIRRKRFEIARRPRIEVR